MSLRLYPDLQRRILCTSAGNASAVTKIIASRQDLLDLLVQPVEPNPNGGFSTTPLQVVDVTPYTLQVLVGNYGEPLADQLAFTKDEDANTFAGAIDLDTDEVEALFADDPDKITLKLQLRFLTGANPISIAVAIEISNQVYVTGAPPPTVYTLPSELLDALMTVLVDTYSVARSLVGATIELALRRLTAGGLSQAAGGVYVDTCRLLSTVAYAANVAIDMNGTPRQKIVCTGDIELATTNRPAAGQYKEVEVLIMADGVDVDVTYAAGITQVGQVLAQIPDGELALIRVRCWGADEADTVVQFLPQI